MEERWLPVGEFAAHLGVNPEAIYNGDRESLLLVRLAGNLGDQIWRANIGAQQFLTRFRSLIF